MQAAEPLQQPRNYTIVRSFTDHATIGRLRAVMLHKRLVLEPQAGLARMWVSRLLTVGFEIVAVY